MEETFNFQEILQLLKKRIILILSVTLGFVLMAAIITFFLMTPSYEASTQVLVNQSQNNEEPITSTELESNREFINTYSVIITSPTILEPVIEETNFGGSVGELREKITVTAEDESQVASVTVQDTDPEKAVSLVNALTNTFEQQIPNIMNVDNVSILSEAQLENSNAPVSPQPLLNLIVALVLGMIVGIGLALLIELLDKSLKTEQDIEKHLGLPILGVVPIMQNTEFNKPTQKTNSSINMRSKSREERNTL